MPSVKERLAMLALLATGTTPAELAQLQRAWSDRWAPIVAASGLEPEQLRSRLATLVK